MVVDAPPAVDARAPHDVCVTAEEAAFIQAAFERILPEAPGVPAWTYVDRKLAEQRRGDGPARELILYRQGIARVEARCRLDHRRDFQALDVWHQLAILAELEDPEREDPDSLRRSC